MIVVVDLGMGNIGSIANMLKKVGATCQISSSAAEIGSAEKLILPGVGAFDNAISAIERLNLRGVLNERVIERKVPVLGVCLGMQLLTKKSEEGSLPGLGWIDADTIRFRLEDRKDLKIPHMGWNAISVRKESPLYRDMYDDARFYFVHSFYVSCRNSEDILASTEHGIEFTSSVAKENVFGAQFHPEKSHKFGMKLYNNFVSYC